MTTRTGLRALLDRRDAGRALAEAVRSLELEDPVVLGLPRGGVPVAFEVARALDAPLAALPGRAELTVVPRATHLFEEPGALDEVARLPPTGSPDT